MKIRDRIRELRRVPASQIAPNPMNWRTHPKRQSDALRGMLEEVGIADAVICRQRPDGVLELIDGHLRVETLGDGEVPVLVLDVTEEEAKKLLATIDPLAAMAEADPRMLETLLAEIETSNDAITKMLHDLAGDNGISEEVTDKYTKTIQLPIYEVVGDKPAVSELFDATKTKRLVQEIDATGLPAELAGFLRAAAARHTVFNFRAIAEFYAHCDERTQRLMEQSALVIIDFDAAIENGFVKLTKTIGELVEVEQADA